MRKNMQIRLTPGAPVAFSSAIRLHAFITNLRACHASLMKHFRLASCAAHTSLLSLLLLLCLGHGGIPWSSPALCHAIGYSYSRFAGPVSGPEQKVFVRDAISGDTSVDYIAKPEYEFAYGVEDLKARVLHNREEMRDGDAVQGVYSVVDPDGTLRVVKYTADNLNGFRAEVITKGVPIIHGRYTNTGNDDAQWQPQQQQVQHVENAEDNSNHAGKDDTGEDYDDNEGGYEVHEPSGENNDHDDESNGDGADADDYSNDSKEDAYENASAETHSYEEEDSRED